MEFNNQQPGTSGPKLTKTGKVREPMSASRKPRSSGYSKTVTETNALSSVYSYAVRYANNASIPGTKKVHVHSDKHGTGVSRIRELIGVSIWTIGNDTQSVITFRTEKRGDYHQALVCDVHFESDCLLTSDDALFLLRIAFYAVSKDWSDFEVMSRIDIDCVYDKLYDSLDLTDSDVIHLMRQIDNYYNEVFSLSQYDR